MVTEPVLGYGLSLLIISDSKRGFLSVQNIHLWPDNLLIYFDFCFLPLSVFHVISLHSSVVVRQFSVCVEEAVSLTRLFLVHVLDLKVLFYTLHYLCEEEHRNKERLFLCWKI